MFTKYDFASSFRLDDVCLPKEKHKFQTLKIYSFSYSYKNLHKNICYFPIQLLKI
jgi:hypothetical protein